MADLEDLGFLTHPHISAGRVPTDLGYRTFVRELMTVQKPSEADRARIASELDSESFEMDRFLQATSRILSRLTGEVAMVAAPDSLSFVLQSVHFTRVAERKVLVVQVSDSGLVESRLIETRDEFSHEELEAMSRRLTVDFAGKVLGEIRTLLLLALKEEKVRVDEALARTLEMAQRAFAEAGGTEGALFVEGTETILEKPEFKTDVDALRKMFRAFDEKVRLVNLLTDCVAGGGTRVVIGSENPFTDEIQSAIVTTAYRRGERTLGSLGVIGPRRMEYARIVPIVEELGRYVSRRLTEGAS